MKNAKNVRLLFDVTNRASNVLMDTETGVVFSKQDPLKTVPYISKSVERALMYGKLIDVDDVLEIKLPARIKEFQQRLIKSLGIVPVTHETASKETVDEKEKEPVKEEGKAPKEETVDEKESKKKTSTKKAKDKEVETTEE